MAFVVSEFVAKLRWDTNHPDLAKARGSADKLIAATKQLEAEQKKSSRTTAEQREKLTELKVALDKGLISKKEFKKQSTQCRLAIEDETNEMRRANQALAALRDAHKQTAAAARMQEKAENAAAAATAAPPTITPPTTASVRLAIATGTTGGSFRSKGRTVPGAAAAVAPALIASPPGS